MLSLTWWALTLSENDEMTTIRGPSLPWWDITYLENAEMITNTRPPSNGGRSFFQKV